MLYFFYFWNVPHLNFDHLLKGYTLTFRTLLKYPLTFSPRPKVLAWSLEKTSRNESRMMKLGRFRGIRFSIPKQVTTPKRFWNRANQRPMRPTKKRREREESNARLPLLNQTQVKRQVRMEQPKKSRKSKVLRQLDFNQPYINSFINTFVKLMTKIWVDFSIVFY